MSTTPGELGESRKELPHANSGNPTQAPASPGLIHGLTADSLISETTPISPSRDSMLWFMTALAHAIDGFQIAVVFDYLSRTRQLTWGAAVVSAVNAESVPVREISIDLSHGTDHVSNRLLSAELFDAALVHLRSTTLSVILDAAVFQQAGHGEFYDAIADSLAPSDVCVHLSLPRERHFLVRFIDKRRSWQDRNNSLSLLCQLRLLAVHIAEATRASDADDSEPSPLSAQERQILQLTLSGHTALQVADQMRLAEAVVARTASASASKLGCSGKHHAAARALYSGWLHPLSAR